MNHLGDQISALVDGELSGVELDRANAHLVACADCQTEAATLRRLKRVLRDVGETDCPDDVTRRLLALGDQGQSPARRLARQRTGHGRRTHGRRTHERRRRARAGRTKTKRLAPRSAPASGGARRPQHDRHHRGRYMIWSAVSLVVVGIGAAAFSMGGPPGGNERQITPHQLEVFDIQHAITSGDVPFVDPSQQPAETTKP